jgi:hypothetical protein
VIKLYKTVDGRLHYHEAWVDGMAVVEHWGPVGETGETREHPRAKGRRQASALAEVLRGGYSRIYQESAEA